MTASTSLKPETYWHLTDRSAFLLNNVHLGKGWTASHSFTARFDGLAEIGTPYAFHASRDDKEQQWESVRNERFSHLPSRQKALFLFTSKDDGERAMEEWFPGCEKLLLEARITSATAVHVADARHLETTQPLWPEAALLYWEGILTPDPRLEVVVDGPIYFPNWQHPPFGLLSLGE
ncbi:hypothetical protein [Mesorhizobium sp. ZC-5]|uniref:hypothetical protein n=1 Tax=Mesorhizobium sp. ZC-5 TaxID=2986066 RepID=UPI0021E96497|nr:hypothetical protein [Mesorhizobium sp. ZC-5]MCV3239685.1 hypothetical protein [Mesorhizobium sp. ZC-5]